MEFNRAKNLTPIVLSSSAVSRVCPNHITRVADFGLTAKMTACGNHEDNHDDKPRASVISRGPHRHVEDAGNTDGAADAVQAQSGYLWVVAVLETHAEGGQEWGPSQLRESSAKGAE